MVWAEIENTVHIALSSAQAAHKPVFQGRQQKVRAYCSNIYCAIDVRSSLTTKKGKSVKTEYIFEKTYQGVHFLTRPLHGSLEYFEQIQSS